MPNDPYQSDFNTNRLGGFGDLPDPTFNNGSQFSGDQDSIPRMSFNDPYNLISGNQSNAGADNSDPYSYGVPSFYTPPSGTYTDEFGNQQPYTPYSNIDPNLYKNMTNPSVTGTSDNSVYPGGSGGAQPGDPAYNNPLYDSQREAQQGNPNPLGGSDTNVPGYPGTSLPVGTGNPGTDPNNSPKEGDFFSGTANHWVDPTYGTDATDRQLSPEETAYWQGLDRARASGTLDQYLKSVVNPGIAQQQAAQQQQQAQAPIAPPPPPTPVNPYPGNNTQNSHYQFQDGVDYSKVGAIDAADFQGNSYAAANANRLPGELDPNTTLKGGIDEQKYSQLKGQYGYQMAQNGIADYNSAERLLYAAGAQHPENDYYLVDVAGGGYAILQRARALAGQQSYGFDPSKAFNPPPTQPGAPGGGSAGGGGGGGSSSRGGGSSTQSRGGVSGGGSTAGNGGVQRPPAPVPSNGLPAGYPAQGSGAYGMSGMLGANHRNPQTGQTSPNYPNTAVEGATRQNLQTGQTEVFHNGQWVVMPSGGNGGQTPMSN